MYNRYIPQPDGSWRKSQVQERVPPPPPAPPPAPARDAPGKGAPPRQPPPAPAPPPRPRQPHRPGPAAGNTGDFLRSLLPKNFDTGDLLVVLLLLLMCGEKEEDQNTALLTLALYFFL